jgi:hypothetical protein
MPKIIDPRSPIRVDDAPTKHPEYDASRVILVRHNSGAGPVTAVKNVLIQSSLAELKSHGYYERYSQLMAAEALETLQLSLAPGWIPIELALAHYDACDRLELSPAQFAAIGKDVGNRVQDAVLISLAKKVRAANYDLDAALGPLQRMWPRLFQGGSVQTVRVAPQERLLEERGFRLNRYHYYRQGHVAALIATYRALGIQLAEVKIDNYDATNDEMIVRVSWH